MTHDEKNRLAAEKVMGWKWCDDCELFVSDSAPFLEIESWNPCTSIADAWRLVEKMVRDEFCVLVTLLYHDGKLHADCSVNRDDSFNEAQADTAPLAITMACLKAVGVL